MTWVWEKATDAIEDVGDVVADVVEGVGGAVMDAVEDVGDVVTGIIEDPKKLAAVAISVAFPGAGTAIGQSLLGPALSASIGAVGTQIIGQTIINTAINGGDLEQGLLVAGVSAVTPMLAKEISTTAVEQGVDKTIANAGAKVAAGTIQAAALGQDPLTAFTFGAVDQATDAILNKAITESGLQKEFSALPAPAKIAVSSAITSALTGADASMLAANQIVQNAIGMAAQEVKKQDAKEFFRNQFSDIGFDMTEDELDQVFQNIDSRDQAKNLAQEIKDFPSFEYYKNFGGDKEKFEEFVGKTEEDKIVEFLESQGVSATPERVAAIAKEFNIDITKPVEGLSSAVDRYKQSNVLSADEVKQIAQSKGISITDDEAMRYVGEGDKSSLQSRLDSFLDFKASDQKQLQTNNAKIATNILDALEAEGYTPETINKLIGDGTVQRYVDQYKQAQQQTVENLRNNAVFAEQQFGANSEQALQARRNALDAMSAFGGYGVSKDQQGNFKTADAEIDPNTMLAVYKGSSGGFDPITGQMRVNIVWNPETEQITYGDWLSKQKDQPYAGLIASGQSANPPETGGRSVFGSGSGVQGSFPGLSLVAVDNGTGAKVYEDMNGKALVMYSDGKAFIKDKGSDQINWIPLQEIPRITEELKKIDIKTEQDTKQKDQAIAEINKNIDQGFVNPSEALELLRNQGFNPTEADAQKISGLKTSEQAAQEAAQYAQANTVTRDEARQALIEAGVTNPTDFDIDALVGQYAQTDLTSKVQQAKPMAEIRSAVRDVIGEGNSVAVDEIRKQMQANEASGLSRDQALNKAVGDVATSVGATKEELLAEIGITEQSLRDLYTTGQQQTATQITDLQKSLSDKIAANEAAGLSRDEATNKAIQDVSANLGTTKEQLLGQIGQTEQSLRDLYTTGQQQTQEKISALDASTQAKFDALTQEQQNQALALAQSTNDLKGAINTVAQTSAEQLAGVKSELEGQLTAQGKSIMDALVKQGVDYNTALNTAMTQQGEKLAETEKTLTGQISGLSASTQAQFGAMSAAQQAEVAARVKMGEDLGKAIGDVSGQVAGLGSQVSGLGAELEAQRKADEAYRAEQARLAEEAAKKAEQKAESARFAAMLPALGIGLGAGATQPVVDESIPQAKAEFLTTKGDTKFEGLLSDFQQKVEENDGLFDNPTTEEGSRDMGSYYSYGNEMPVESVLGLGGDQQTDSTDSSQNPYDRGYFFAQGGMVAPLMAAQGGHMSAGTRYGKYAKGGMPSPLMAAGGKMRVDFRKGDAVTGPGDGQSDDIPAMLADGEFVFPADVVAAIGNGSTKAGSDALYDMMHSIRAHVRSAKPKDLPPEIKSPLDFLKTKKRRA